MSPFEPFADKFRQDIFSGCIRLRPMCCPTTLSPFRTKIQKLGTIIEMGQLKFSLYCKMQCHVAVESIRVIPSRKGHQPKSVFVQQTLFLGTITKFSRVNRKVSPAIDCISSSPVECPLVLPKSSYNVIFFFFSSIFEINFEICWLLTQIHENQRPWKQTHSICSSLMEETQ